MSRARFDIVIPTIGRPSLARLLRALAQAKGPQPGCIAIVDDRVRPRVPLVAAAVPPSLAAPLFVLRSAGRGPAAARNVGWRAASAEWIAFLDDDTVPADDWLDRLEEDLVSLDLEVAGSQGRSEVPRPLGRVPSAAERNAIALEAARWITADMAYRRSVLAELGGFDERFRRSFREDRELALRVLERGHGLAQGNRRTQHPLREEHAWASVAAQAGNADDVLMCALHGRSWRQRTGAAPGRLGRHALVTAAGVVATAAWAFGALRVASIGGLAWSAGSLEFAAARSDPGPHTLREIAALAWTSLAIPPLAVFHHLRGRLRCARLRRRGELSWRAPACAGAPRRLRLVLFDRDGTLIEDAPDLREPARVQPLAQAAAALQRLRDAGVRVAIVSNQPGIAAGRLARADLERVHAELERRLGPFAGIFVCPHAEGDGCVCRKPAPGLLVDALQTLGVPVEETALIGDIGSDIAAAEALGLYAILVPTPVTRPEEIAAAPVVASDLGAAVDRLLGGKS